MVFFWLLPSLVSKNRECIFVQTAINWTRFIFSLHYNEVTYILVLILYSFSQQYLQNNPTSEETNQSNSLYTTVHVLSVLVFN